MLRWLDPESHGCPTGVGGGGGGWRIMASGVQHSMRQSSSARAGCAAGLQRSVHAGDLCAASRCRIRMCSNTVACRRLQHGGQCSCAWAQTIRGHISTRHIAPVQHAFSLPAVRTQIGVHSTFRGQGCTSSCIPLQYRKRSESAYFQQAGFIRPAFADVAHCAAVAAATGAAGSTA